VLGTNAHCLSDFERWKDQKAQLWVVQNGHAEQRYEVVRRVTHPGYTPVARGGRKSPDVALLFVAADLPSVVPVATDAELRAVGAGTAIYAYGFPGRFMRAEAPEASFVDGRIGRLTTLEETVGPPERTQLLQHTAVTHGGTSGSPLFGEDGRVIGINAGTYNAAEEELLLDPRTGRPIMQVAVAGRRTGYKYAMRIDLLRELAAAQGLKVP
jgi:S1-C subfamily serine protease